MHTYMLTYLHTYLHMYAAYYRHLYICVDVPQVRSTMAGFGKVPLRAAGRWQERQHISERNAKEGWGLQRQWRRVVGFSMGTLVIVVAATVVSTAAIVSMVAPGHFAGGAGVGDKVSVETLLLKRLLETSENELQLACSRTARIGAGASATGGWNVCLDSELGRRWDKAGTDRQRRQQGETWSQRTPVHCRFVSVHCTIHSGRVCQCASPTLCVHSYSDTECCMRNSAGQNFAMHLAQYFCEHWIRRPLTWPHAKCVAGRIQCVTLLIHTSDKTHYSVR